MVRYRRPLLLLCILLILALACGESSIVAPTPVFFSSPLAGTAERIAEATAAQAIAQATVQAAAFQVTVQAAQSLLEQQRLEATRVAAQATSQAQATISAFSMQLTAQAVAQQATAQAVQLLLEQQKMEATRVAAQATSQAQATISAFSMQLTAQHVTAQARLTATAETWYATRMAYQATATRAAEQREIVLGYGRDFVLPLFLLAVVVALLVLIFYIVRQHSKRPIVYRRGLLGDADPLAVPTADGGLVLVDIDRQPGPAIIIRPDGSVLAPQLRNPAQEERTTARDQMVDAMTRPRLGRPPSANPPLPLAPPPNPPGLRRIAVLRNLDQAGKAGLLPPGWALQLEEDWQEDSDDE